MTRLSAIIGLCFSATTCTAWSLSSTVAAPWLESWPAPQNPLYGPSNSKSCVVSKTGRHEMANGREKVPTVTSHGPNWDWEQPAITPLNSTAGEQWEFDGVSEDGKQAFIFGLYRDPNYSFLGTGNLRAYVEMTFDDGTSYAVVDYAEEAIITTCPGVGTYGVWRGPGFVYTFEASEDMSKARWTMESLEANVTVDMTSVAHPRYPDNSEWSKQAHGSTETVPHFFWVEPIPVAEITAQISVRDKKYQYAGVGGHERLWSAFNLRTCIRSLKAVRFRAGPYSLSFEEYGSSRDPALTFSSVSLFKEGKNVFSVAGETRGESNADVEVVNEGQSRFTLRKLYDDRGNTTQHLSDKVTGVELILEDRDKSRTWSFTVIFHRVIFEYVLTEGRGGTGYSGLVAGGLQAEEGHSVHDKGPAFVEIMRFPDGDWWLLPNNYVD